MNLIRLLFTLAIIIWGGAASAEPVKDDRFVYEYKSGQKKPDHQSLKILGMAVEALREEYGENAVLHMTMRKLDIDSIEAQKILDELGVAKAQLAALEASDRIEIACSKAEPQSLIKLGQTRNALEARKEKREMEMLTKARSSLSESSFNGMMAWADEVATPAASWRWDHTKTQPNNLQEEMVKFHNKCDEARRAQ